MTGILMQPMAQRVPIVGDRTHAHHASDWCGAEAEDRVKELALVECIGGVSHGAREGG